MAAKPWGSRFMEQSQTATPLSKTCADSIKGSLLRLSEPNSVRVRKNNVTMRMLVKPPRVGQTIHSSSSPIFSVTVDVSDAIAGISICSYSVPSLCVCELAIDGITVCGFVIPCV
ncbi:Hypothetical predicted protein [Olea europaea subsp. europaea]|uniref:Uncharacterized protein n=1 Tax=Olea europaea subsp. europaea TaxID=158383 RepID=A0A8S0Q2U5_OLEEU|nr:Hypothetical predicted protein [Olea europaea subsp. europaea]